jgi:biotin carboxyl carrier protein
MVCSWSEREHEEQVSGWSSMSQAYILKLDGKDFRVEVKLLDEGGLLVVRVNGQSYTFKPDPKEDGSVVLNDTASDHIVKILKRSGQKVQVELDGRTQDVEWERIRKAESTGASSSSTAATSKRRSGGVYPPMPGKITEVRIKVGDKVTSGQTLCILEAMKMFNELKAPRDGEVKQLNVQKGSAVTPNDLLVLVE